MSSQYSSNPTHLWQRDLLREAVAEARAVEGRTSPNPSVGAVVVRNGAIVGRGGTQPPGGPHAEKVALRMAGEAARGADLYTTLEPCSFHGRTPPCVDAIIAAGIRRVYYVARDPDPRMGRGADHILRAAGVELSRLPDYTGEVGDLLAPFRCRVLAGRPLVSVKYAMSLDGRIATAGGESRWISGPDSRRVVHQLRDRVDAILVGVGTVLADDPRLTTRLDDHWRPVRHPLRVIVDSHGRTPVTAQILDPLLPGQTLIATVDAPQAWVAAVTERGARVERLPAGDDGRVALPALLAYLASLGINHLLVESGGGLLGALAAAQLIDAVWAFIGPKLIGGASAPGPLGDPGVMRLADAQQFGVRRVERCGTDLLMTATATTASWWDIDDIEEEEPSHVHGNC